MNSSISHGSRSIHLLRSLVSAGSLSRTGKALGRQLWLWPLLAALALCGVGWWTYRTVAAGIQHQVASNLLSTRQAQVAALEIWFKGKKNDAAGAAVDPEVRKVIQQLVDLPPEKSSREALLQSPLAQEIRTLLAPIMMAEGYEGFTVYDRQNIIRASGRDELIGRKQSESMAEALAKVFAGQTTVSRPFPSVAILKDDDGRERSSVPTMFALAPVRDPQGKVIAGLGFRIDPTIDFTRILSVARAGNTDESYAFDKHGLLLSGSRFDEDLRAVGLLVDSPDSDSILNVELRDPGVDMTQGLRPGQRRREQPLTQLVQSAIAGQDGVNVSGYRDYRGALVVGAWTWLPEYGMGIAVEMDYDEAYGGLGAIRWVFWGLIGLLVVAAIGIQIVMIRLARTQRSLRAAALQARQLGQYTLEDKLGAGGMGVVYKARHSLLRRPTAVKLLDVDKTSPDAIARFQREVQLTSQLCHPNTIAIFDFGHTPEGIFYYAMELLDGLPLDKLVEKYGPLPGRVIRILEQVCGSLAEAHDHGLVHRDIKPANIILNRRGGECDVVKVLDFGLVKAMDSDKEASLTTAGAITGTPQYLSPEGIDNPETVDPRSDLYAVGAVGYFLVTGTPVFSGRTLMDLLNKQTRELPESPSQRLGRPIDAALEQLLLRCLAKKKEDRPGGARSLADDLSDLTEAKAWTRRDAEDWWDNLHKAADKPPPPQGGETVLDRATLTAQD